MTIPTKNPNGPRAHGCRRQWQVEPATAIGNRPSPAAAAVPGQAAETIRESRHSCSHAFTDDVRLNRCTPHEQFPAVVLAATPPVRFGVASAPRGRFSEDRTRFMEEPET